MVTNGFLVEVERANLDELSGSIQNRSIAPSTVPPGSCLRGFSPSREGNNENNAYRYKHVQWLPQLPNCL